MLEALKEEVCRANHALVDAGLVKLTWGNVSGIDRERGVVAIKPSGVPYSRLEARHIVLVGVDGNVVEGDLRPSSDTPTHLALYRAFGGIGGVTHTHSTRATAFAQACCPIPCLGTTHADQFAGEVPVARALSSAEVESDYEGNTGKVIVERFEGLDAMSLTAVLCAHHGPFTWGRDAMASVENSIALEAVAEMALHTFSLAPAIGPIPEHIRLKHFTRKHGPTATYGQV